MTVSRGFNDFNRKDLFTQHCRRMHKFSAWGAKEYNQVSKMEKEEFDAYMEDVRERCWIQKRDPPGKIGCGLCGEVFIEGEGRRDVWESRMEHVAKHYELDVDKATEKADKDLLQWCLDNDIVRLAGDRSLLTQLVGDHEFASARDKQHNAASSSREWSRRKFDQQLSMHQRRELGHGTTAGFWAAISDESSDEESSNVNSSGEEKSGEPRKRHESQMSASSKPPTKFEIIELD
jgi:hypothetical protein